MVRLQHTATTGADPVAPKYRPDVDGLRALAILSVVIYHADPASMPGGFTGVDVFFVISGYLISKIIYGGLANGTFSFRDFYARRIRRIFPALLPVLALTFAVGWFVLGAPEYRELGTQLAASAAFVANLQLWHSISYFDSSASTQPLLHLWSLGVEEQFYILWPLLLWAAWRAGYRRAGLVLGLLLGVASFAWSIHAINADATEAYYSPLARGWELMAGCVLAGIDAWRPEWLRRFANLRSLLGLLLVVAGFFLVNHESRFPGWWALLPVLGTVLMISGGMSAWLNRRVLALRPLVAIGLISYPLYLWHWPILAYARILRAEETFPAEIAVVLVLSGAVMAWLTWRFLERYLRAARFRFLTATLATGMMAVFALGLVTDVQDGMPARAINKGEKTEFLHYYKHMHEQELFQSYREDCDFYDWNTVLEKPAISASCTQTGPRGTVFLWGDSHAQALSLGLRESLPPGVALAQVATSGCAPRLKDAWQAFMPAMCNHSNRYARAIIHRIHPDTVVLAQHDHHEQTDWNAIADFLHGEGVKRVVLVGPVPQWKTSLPDIVAGHYWGVKDPVIKTGLVPEVLATDAQLTKQYAGSQKLLYVSVIQQLCTAAGCHATVPTAPDHNLLAMDYGHLTAVASRYVAGTILTPRLQAAATAPVPAPAGHGTVRVTAL